jgi:murein L,D-transpeptidase YafK
VFWLLWGLGMAAEPVCYPTTSALAEKTAKVQAEDPRLLGDALIVVEKASKRIALYRNGKLERCWPVGLATEPSTGRPPVGPKRVRGDLKTPEGWYRTSDKPWSSYYKAIYIHYPNADDAADGLARGALTVAEAAEIERALAAGKVPSQGTALGGELLIHGGGASSDWTLGCVAMEDKSIDELRGLLPAKMLTDLLIVP